MDSKDKQLDAASFLGRVATFLLIAFLVERVGTTYIGGWWGAALAVGVMLVILAGLLLWTRRKRKG